MATAKAAPAEHNPAYNSIDVDGAWFESKAQFPMEDLTYVHEEGKGARLPRFEAGGFTQAIKTPWVEAQCKAGVLVEYTKDPRKGGEPVAVEAEKPAAKPADAAKK